MINRLYCNVQKKATVLTYVFFHVLIDKIEVQFQVGYSSTLLLEQDFVVIICATRIPNIIQYEDPLPTCAYRSRHLGRGNQESCAPGYCISQSEWAHKETAGGKKRRKKKPVLTLASYRICIRNRLMTNAILEIINFELMVVILS